MRSAFDTVSLDILLSDILSTNIPWQIKRWLNIYISGRQTFVFRNAKLKYRKMKQGVPQRGVLSPTLFNLYLSKIPTPPTGINITSYADDCTILTTGTNIEEMTNNFLIN